MRAPKNREETPELRKGIGLIDVVTLGTGASIGVAIFSVLSPAAQVAGPGMLLSMALAGVPMVVFAITYAFMASAVPVSGASFAWPSRFVHPYFGFLVAWLRILGSAGAMAVLALVLIRYVSTVFPLPTRLSMLMLFAVIFILNFFGVSSAARFQTAMMGLLFGTFTLFVIAGSREIDPGHFQPLMSAGWTGVIGAVPLLVSLFLGIEAATEVGEEVRGGGRVIARGIAISVLLAMLIYFAVSSIALGVLGPDGLANTTAPLLTAADRFLGAWSGPIMLTAAVAAIGTSLNSVFIIFSRYLFAMGRAGVLPGALGHVHPRRGTPDVATTVAFACCTASLLLPQSLVFLFLAVNIPTMLKYLGTCLSATRLLRNRPDLYRKAAFRLDRSVTAAWAYAGVMCAILIILAGFNADWRPYVVIIAWAAIGTFYWIAGPGRSARAAAAQNACTD